ncbi:MAG: AraC family transcriptional regulator [Paenibacillus sp.]|nr:AraC family transcriptional regulator [Paenibacillus sp.]
MDSQQRLTHLLKNAELDVLQFGMSTRTDMNYRNREFKSYYMMSYHKSGYAKLRVGETVYPINPGSVIFIPPNLDHDQYKENLEEAVILWWHFTYKVEHVLDVLTLFNIPFIYTLKHGERFEAVFDQFMQSTRPTSSLPVTILQKAKSLELLYLLLDEALEGSASAAGGEYSESFLSMLCKIVLHPDKQVSLTHWAEEMHMNPTYVSTRFRELFGQSPIQLQRRLRIEKAKSLLTIDRQMSVAQIAESLGFTEAANFTRLFKKYTGMAPLHYRQLFQTPEQR